MMSYAGTIFNLIKGAYDSHKTQEFRTSVLDNLALIEAELAEIKALLKTIVNKIDYQNVVTAIHNSQNDIAAVYSHEYINDWLKSGTPLSQNHKDDIASYKLADKLVLIHNAVTGNLDGGYRPWLEVYGNLHSHNPSNSKVEAMYKFYKSYILGTQVKAIALLAAAELTEDLKVATGELVKHLPSQMTTCQDVVDKLPADAPYVGRFDNQYRKQGGKPGVNWCVDLPTIAVEGHVILGWSICNSGANGCYSLELIHGPVDGAGNVTKAITQSEQNTYRSHYNPGNRYYGFNDDQNENEHYVTYREYICMQPLQAPEGYVITNMGLRLTLEIEVNKPSGRSHPAIHHYRHQGIYLEAKCCKLKADGTPDPNDSVTIFNDNTTFSVSNDNQVSQYYLQFYRDSSHFCGNTLQQTPMTGAQWYHTGTDFVATSKESYHQKMFTISG